MRAAALCALLASGCAFGGSSSVVGRWRARRIVDSTACVQSQAPGGGCEKLITIGRDLPARRFSSLSLVFPATGYMQARDGGKVGHGVVLNSYFEYVRGRGGFALGARVGAEVGDGFGSRLFFLTPVSVVAHAGGLWGSVYAGAGYSPVTTEQQYTGDKAMPTLPATWHHNSVHVFAGTRFWLRRTLERGLSFNPELRLETFGTSTLVSLTANIGIHF
jgi:hypothetical protein